MLRYLQTHLAWLALVLGMCVLSTSQIACSCREELTAEEKKKKEEEEAAKKKKGEKEKPKPDFEFRDTRTVPSEIVSNTPRNGVKPGHWVTIGSTIVANNFDFQAELHTAAVDEFGDPLDIDHTNFYLRSHRPAPLPKGQPKFFENTCYVPRRLLPKDPTLAIGMQKRTLLENELTSKGGGHVGDAKKGEVITVMEGYQYYLIVLASSPSSYSYMRVMDTVAPRYNGDLTESTGSMMPYYRFASPTLIKSIPLPSTALTWTSVAVLVYDDIDPSMFTSEQQQALLDWLHWGGQLVISGPRSLERLRGSFLEPYLPAMGGDALPLTEDSFAEFNETWGLMPKERPFKKLTAEELGEEMAANQNGGYLPPQFPGDPDVKKYQRNREREDEKNLFPRNDPTFRVQVLKDRPILGVTLKLQPGGSFLPESGELVAERWAGRGRVVTTSFPLTDARIYNWRNFDNFFNNGLLRRPARQWKMSGYDELQVNWANYPAKLRDPRLVCNLRYFSRDVAQLSDSHNVLLDEGAVDAGRRRLRGRGSDRPDSSMDEVADDSEEAAAENADEGYAPNLNFNFRKDNLTGEEREKLGLTNEYPTVDPAAVARNDWYFAGYEQEIESGVAGWNDFSGAANAAKQALTDAAKVKIPKADFVLKMVGLYLLVLVPVNWAIFRAIRRVEWAWIAAPLIAITAAGVVIRLAQLDIGFVRSRTDIGIVEMQGGFDRAHVTRYTALYTSLSTGYDLVFDDANALALPLAERQSYKRNISNTSALPISFQRDKDATMQGFQVDSSSTAWTHSEQMLSAGRLQLTGDAATGWQLANQTDWTIREVAVIQRVGNGFQVAWVETLAPQTSVKLKYTAADEPRVAQWQTSSVMSEHMGDKNEVRLWRLADLATRRLPMLVGETRLVGWMDKDITGLEIHPTSSQFTRRSLVIAHLQRPDFPPPVPDVNTQADVDGSYGRVLTEDDFQVDEKSDNGDNSDKGDTEDKPDNGDEPGKDNEPPVAPDDPT